MKVQSCEMMSQRGDVHILIRNYALYEGIKPLYSLETSIFLISVECVLTACS